VERNYEIDLKSMFEEIRAISGKVLSESKSIYDHNGLFFDDSAFRAVEGDIHTKVLGKYLQHVLGVEPKYEVRIVGKIRADINLCDMVTIEVKSHGQFNSTDLKKRFERVVQAKPDMKHLYVAFRERQDFIEKTLKLLKPLGVECFFMSTYATETNPMKKLLHGSLRDLLETVMNKL
jgi:hypothetical protein